LSVTLLEKIPILSALQEVNYDNEPADYGKQLLLFD